MNREIKWLCAGIVGEITRPYAGIFRKITRPHTGIFSEIVRGMCNMQGFSVNLYVQYAEMFR